MADQELSRRRAASIERRLERNRARRQQARAEADRARDELAQLLVAGREAGLEVAAMCRLAGLSREMAYRLLRRSG